MKKTHLKHTRNCFTSQKWLVLSCIALLFLTLTGNAQTRLNLIDGVYIERPRLEKTSDTNSVGNNPVVEPFSITDTKITDCDVIAFDIPGFNDFMRENKKLLKNVILKIDQIELPEFPAYIESAESDVVRFRFANRNLSNDNRKLLYKLPGRSNKVVQLGIKIDETNILYFNEPTNIYFKEIELWGNFGWVLIIAFFLFFGLLIFTNTNILRDNVTQFNLSEKERANFSFSKSQFAFWTFIIITSFIFIWAFTRDLNSINNTALILLGITSATIATSNLINKDEEKNADTEKLRNFRVSKPGVKSNFLREILSDTNGISIHRLQALAFNLIFGIAFFQAVLFNYSMPEFSQTQLLLLGLSNGTYAFLKNSENK